MLKEEVETLEEALFEVWLSFLSDKNDWTYHHRLLFQDAMQIVEKYKNGYRSAA